VHYPLRKTTWYDKSLKDLGVPDAQFVTAKLKEQFEPDWTSPDVSLADLNQRWEYKKPKSDRACATAEIRQIRVGKDIRVLLTLVHEQRTAFYLEAYHKTSPAAQEAAIKRACGRAKQIREERKDGTRDSGQTTTAPRVGHGHIGRLRA
jgi:hypothetical protein